MKTAELHPHALRDIEEAASFYEREGSAALAARFVAEFERVAKLILADPGLGTPRARGRKGFPATDFPYTVIYREVPTGIRILVVKHDRRQPGYGGSRR
ncbi:type II toxin-antitoxin system RelE/ParE family toxin [Piscinibacter sp.]|uniref:type II toxin-antitoxin system RelE/ParE family toxin n=1 Tax=Piscinibacter sp. TaxID=1903157 RepID=UPI0039E5BD73